MYHEPLPHVPVLRILPVLFSWKIIFGCLPLKGRRKKYKRKAKIKPHELNQYNPCATRNDVNAKPVF
jgi:hypothetical protein